MIGDMKQIVLEQWEQVKSATGILEDSLIARYRLWAEVKRINANKAYDNQVQMKAGYTFKIYFNKDFAPGTLSKVVYKRSRYNIHSIEDINERRFNKLIKTEGDVG